jgi:hypothetical protein
MNNESNPWIARNPSVKQATPIAKLRWANNLLGEIPGKKNPALSRRAEETPNLPGHAPSGLISHNLARLQLIAPPRPPQTGTR